MTNIMSAGAVKFAQSHKVSDYVGEECIADHADLQ